MEGNRQYIFRTVVSEVSFFVVNPVYPNQERRERCREKKMGSKEKRKQNLEKSKSEKLKGEGK